MAKDSDGEARASRNNKCNAAGWLGMNHGNPQSPLVATRGKVRPREIPRVIYRDHVAPTSWAMSSAVLDGKIWHGGCQAPFANGGVAADLSTRRQSI